MGAIRGHKTMLRAAARVWHRVHRCRWWLRLPFKLALFVLVVTLVLFPKPWLLPEWCGRLRHVERLIDPHQPALADLEQVVRKELRGEPEPRAALKAVERAVCQRIPYAWDWDVWGVADYVPTVAEVLEKGREDCDGRAVLAASLLRRMGYDAQLVSDLVHVWVVTPAGETMSPGSGEKTLVGSETGTHARLSLQTLANLGRGTAFGIGVFPLGRELIILAVFCGLAGHPGVSRRRWIVACTLLLAALALLRVSGEAVGGRGPMPLTFWVGLTAGVLGWLALVVRGAARRPRSSAAPPE
jgi:hypothetical protein